MSCIFFFFCCMKKWRAAATIDEKKKNTCMNRWMKKKKPERILCCCFCCGPFEYTWSQNLSSFQRISNFIQRFFYTDAHILRQQTLPHLCDSAIYLGIYDDRPNSKKKNARAIEKDRDRNTEKEVREQREKEERISLIQLLHAVVGSLHNVVL